MSAALWLKQLSIDVLLVECEPQLGGLQRLNFLENHWILGEIGKTGPMISESYAKHINALSVNTKLSTIVCSVARENEGFRLALRSPQGLSSHIVSAIILALGTRFRGREVLAHISNLESIDPGRLVCGPFAFQDLNRFAGKRLFVIGAGDNSHEFIRLTAEIADSFVLLARSQRKAQQGLRTAVDALVRQGRCEIIERGSLNAIIPSGSHLLVDFAGTHRQQTEVDSIIVLAGYEPNFRGLDHVFSPELEAQLLQDGNGYLLTDAFGRTTCPGIYAAGDITNPTVPCVVTALASGAVAARTVELELRQKRN